MGNNPAKNHHLDRRADHLAEEGAGDADDLLTTQDLMAWLSVSRQWLEIGRHRGYGPKFIKLGPRMVRYRRAEVIAWLRKRNKQFSSTAEYRAA